MENEPESESEIVMLTQVCLRLGAGEPQARTMAKQLLKRARQLALEHASKREDELRYLLDLMVAGREGRTVEKQLGHRIRPDEGPN